MLLVDSNVLIDVFQNDPDWSDWSTMRLREQSQLHALAINPVIYAEISLSFSSVEKLDNVITGMGIRLEEIPRPALFLAGRAFAMYRRKGGRKSNVLADFFIGAHAAVAGCPLLSRDPRRYQTYFPTLVVVAPEQG